MEGLLLSKAKIAKKIKNENKLENKIVIYIYICKMYIFNNLYSLIDLMYNSFYFCCKRNLKVKRT